MIKEDIRYQDSTVFEGMASISALLQAMELGLHDRRILDIYVDSAKKSAKEKEIHFLSNMQKRFGFGIHDCSASEIDAMTVGSSHGGIIAVCTDRTILSLEENSIKPFGVYYLLDGVEDPYNFGNSLRSLYASGADGIVLPKRNWMSAAGVVARSSAGASELLPMFTSENTADAMEIFRKAGYRILCAGIRNSSSLFETDLSYPLLVIIGGEKRGISASVLQKADAVVRIDYGAEFRGSLSTSASAAVFGFEILRQNKKS